MGFFFGLNVNGLILMACMLNLLNYIDSHNDFSLVLLENYVGLEKLMKISGIFECSKEMNCSLVRGNLLGCCGRR